MFSGTVQVSSCAAVRLQIHYFSSRKKYNIIFVPLTGGRGLVSAGQGAAVGDGKMVAEIQWAKSAVHSKEEKEKGKAYLQPLSALMRNAKILNPEFVVLLDARWWRRYLHLWH